MHLCDLNRCRLVALSDAHKWWTRQGSILYCAKLFIAKYSGYIGVCLRFEIIFPTYGRPEYLKQQLMQARFNKIHKPLYFGIMSEHARNSNTTWTPLFHWTYRYFFVVIPFLLLHSIDFRMFKLLSAGSVSLLQEQFGIVPYYLPTLINTFVNWQFYVAQWSVLFSQYYVKL